MERSHQTKQEQTPYQQLQRLAGFILVFYVAAVCIFPLLAGDQLYYRNSRSNIPMLKSTASAGELTAGGNVNQVFVTNIQRIQKVSVAWWTYGRENAGDVHVELYLASDFKLLASQNMPASVIKTDGMVTDLVLDQPLEGLEGVPLILRLSSANAVPGSSISPIINTDATLDGGSLSIGGQDVPGVLCFAVEGQDYIWMGLHYWKLAVALGTVLLLSMIVMLQRAKAGHSSIILKTMVALKKYRFLIYQLVSRDFKTKYKRSVLGILWSFLNPLLTMLVQYIVFSNLFRTDVPYYPVYLLCGIILFNFFSESCGMMLTSITGNTGLITKVYVPKYIYPLTKMLSSLVNLLLALIPLVIITLASGLLPHKALLLFPIPLICLAFFALGVGLLLSSAMVFFRDTQFLWGVVSMVWMYLTPVFYPISIMPKRFQWIFKCNPLYYFISMARTLLIGGISPEPQVYFESFAFSIGMFAIGAFVFKKNQDRFFLYL